MKKGFKTLSVVLLLCCVFALASCAGSDGGLQKNGFVKPSVRILPGKYAEVYSFVGENIIAKDKNGYARLFSESGKALSEKYDYMEFYGADSYYSVAGDCLIGFSGSAGYILDATTGKEKSGPYNNLYNYNELYFTYSAEQGVGLIYKKDMSVVTYNDKAFIYDDNWDNYGDALRVSSDRYSDKDANGIRPDVYYLVLGGKVIAGADTVSAVSSTYKDELYYVMLSGAGAKPNLYAGGVNLTSDGFTAFTSNVRISLGDNDNYYLIAATKDTAAAEKYCVLSYKAGSAVKTETYAGSAVFNFNTSRAYQYVLRDSKIINLITGGTVCVDAMSISSAISFYLPQRGTGDSNGSALSNGGQVRACQYRNNADKKYYIIGLDGAVLASSYSSWYQYADGKFIVSKGGESVTTGAKFGSAADAPVYTGSNLALVGRSLIRAGNPDWTYNFYNADGGLVIEDVSWYEVCTNSGDNFQYYIFWYENGNGDERARFFVSGKGLSDEFYDCYSMDTGVGGEKTHFAAAATGIRKYKNKGAFEESEHMLWRVFDLNTYTYLTEEADEIWDLRTVAASLYNDEARALVVSVNYTLDADKRRELFWNYTFNFINTGKSFKISETKDIAFQGWIFTGVTVGISVYDAAKGDLFEVYGDNGKKIRTAKEGAFAYFPEQIYFAAKDKPYVVFSDRNGSYGVYDKNFKMVIKPVYDYLEINPLGAVYAYNANAFGILGLDGRTLLSVQNQGLAVMDNELMGVSGTDSPEYFKLYSGAGKKLLGKVYYYVSFDDGNVIKLKEDRAPKVKPGYTETGLTPEEEYVRYAKVYDGKYWRVIKSVMPYTEREG